MNHKGQTLVAFVLLLPILFLFFAYFIEQSKIVQEKIHLNEILAIISSTEEEKIREILYENDEKIELVSYQNQDGKIKITVQKEIESFFGKIIGINTYQIKVEKRIEK